MFYCISSWLYVHNVQLSDVYIWRREHAMFCVEILMYQISLPFMPICMEMMPVILYLFINIFTKTSC